MRFLKAGRTLAYFPLALFIALILCTGAYADTGAEGVVIKEPPEKDYHGKTVILHSNDVNGAVEGYPRMAWLKNEFERLGAEVILVDAGNASAGPIHASGKGAAAMELMNLTGYHIAAVGRNEFVYGYDAMKRNLRRAAFPFLCANAAIYGGTEEDMEDMTESDTLCSRNYSYTTKSGVTVGFFGLLTPKALLSAKADSGLSLVVSRRGDVYRRVQEQIDALRENGDVIPGADIVICLSNLESVGDGSDVGYGSLDIIAKVKGLDLTLGGGNNDAAITSGPNGEALQACGEKFAYIGVVVIDDAARKIEDRWLVASEDLREDPTVLRAADQLQSRFQAEYGTIFARSEADLNGEADPGVRTEETNLGDLIADAIIWSAKQSVEEWDTDENHIVGITNGAGIRASIHEGNITRNMIATAFPFSNTVSVVYLTGAELLETLEASTGRLPEYANSYPQSSGIAFTLDTRIPYDAGELYPESRYARPASIRRLKIDSIRGLPFDPDEVYAVVTNNYCAAGGDSYYLMKIAENRIETDISIEQALVDYISQGLGGVITDAMYGQARGDHVILS